MEEFAVQTAPPPPRHRRSSPELFFISAVLTVGLGGALTVFMQWLNSGTNSSASAGDSRYSAFSGKSAQPTAAWQPGDDGSNMVGEARTTVNMPLLDAPASAPATASAPPTSPRPEAMPGRPAPIGDQKVISEEEKSALGSLFGKWDPETATFVGNKPGLLYTVTDRLARYPRLLKFLFNNDWVIQGLMNQSEVRSNCGSSRALVGYLTDMKRKTGGVSDALAAIAALERHPESLDTFFQSRMAGTMISGCPAMVETMKDTNAMVEIFTKNPAIAKTLADPSVVSAISSGSQSQQLYAQYAKLQAQLR